MSGICLWSVFKYAIGSKGSASLTFKSTQQVNGRGRIYLGTFASPFSYLSGISCLLLCSLDDPQEKEEIHCHRPCERPPWSICHGRAEVTERGRKASDAWDRVQHGVSLGLLRLGDSGCEAIPVVRSRHPSLERPPLRRLAEGKEAGVRYVDCVRLLRPARLRRGLVAAADLEPRPLRVGHLTVSARARRSPKRAPSSRLALPSPSTASAAEAAL